MTHKVLILILAYNAEKHIASVLNRVPEMLWSNPELETEIVIIDDCSKDRTSAVARAYLNESKRPIKLLRNAINQGYGGNQKVGYTYAIEHGFDVVVMVHGDGQYPPEFLPDMIAPLLKGEADAVFGSRMINKGDALKGGMPYYKFVGNIVLTHIQNFMLGSRLAEFHSGYRAYSVKALEKVPFNANSNVFHFDTDIIIQFVDNKLTIREIPIPTHYGDEVCHVNGMRYAWDVMVSTLLSRTQKLGIFYAPKFDYERDARYADKSAFPSSHSYALEKIRAGERVLTLGGDGHVERHLIQRGCTVTSHEQTPMALFENTPFDAILLLDVLEQMVSPEAFMTELHARCVADNPRVIITGPNVAFFPLRLMLLLGQFNYGKRGILDKKHMRLFTFASLKRLLNGASFRVEEIAGIPAPFPLALGDTRTSRFLVKLNGWLIKIGKGFFSYQIAIVARPVPTLELLVAEAIAHGDAVK